MKSWRSLVEFSSKSIRSIQEEFEEPRKIFQSNGYGHQPASLAETLLSLMADDQYVDQEYDRMRRLAKRAKAIVKGDPREFMGWKTLEDPPFVSFFFVNK